jgi:thiol:disulfide interchange protein DsbD
MIKYFLVIVVCILITFQGRAQIQNPVTWSYTIVKATDGNYQLRFTANIEPQWHLYNQNIPEGGPIPTSFSFEKSSKYTLEGKVKELSKAEVIYDSSFMMQLKIFSKKAVFEQKIVPKVKTPFEVKGAVVFMSCNNHQCLPPKTVSFIFNVPAANTAGGAVEPSKSTYIDSTASKENKQITADSSKKTDANNGSPIAPVSQADDNASLWRFFLIAFGFGILGIFTPCVYPMIPMTVSFFMRDEKKRSAGILKAIIFGLSIIFIYTMIGLVLAITKTSAVVTNYVATNWIPNLIFFSLFVVFAISFFGVFEIVLPGTLANKIDKQVDKGGYAASFFMALTLVVVSFSCTAPFVASILVEASQGGLAAKPIMGMFGYSLAFAIPFVIFALSPALMKKLAKSGSWLNSVKVVMAFVLLALSLKYLLAIDSTHHFNILTRPVFISLWIIISILVGLYLLGKIKFAHDSDLPRIGIYRYIYAFISFLFSVYLIFGLFGAPLTELSSILPPAKNSPKVLVNSNCEQPKYTDILDFPSGLTGYFDYQQGIACAQKLNKPILLDFKGHTCSNCKKMEGRVFANQEIQDRLRDDFVLVDLYTDDAFKLPESEWTKSAYDGEVKKTMGDKNLDFEITKYRSNTQPLFSIINSKGDTLGKPMEFNMNVEAFKAFLDNGKTRFNLKK